MLIEFFSKNCGILFFSGGKGLVFFQTEVELLSRDIEGKVSKLQTACLVFS